MADRTGIEWADATWTPIRARNRATGKLGWHCEHFSPGCANCYSEARNRDRIGTRLPFKPGHRDGVEIFLDETMLTQPIRWRRPRTIFVCSMTDLFADFVPDAMIDRVFAVMALAPQHVFQVLTKRSARMRAYCSDPGTPHRVAKAMDALTASPSPLADERILAVDGFPGYFVSDLGRVLSAFRSYAKLTFEQAAEIRGRFQAGETGVALGREFGISNTQARNIGERHQWAVAAPIQWPLPNCWKGISAEDQRRANERVPDLLATPAAVRWVSGEPLLGGIDFTKIEGVSTGTLIDGDFVYPKRIDALTGIAAHYPGKGILYPKSHQVPRLDWIVVGGESGPNARPMHPQWARDIRDACAAAGVPFFFKQHGEWIGVPDLRRLVGGGGPGFGSFDHCRHDMEAEAVRVGKARAGRLLDGVEHSGLPA